MPGAPMCGSFVAAEALSFSNEASAAAPMPVAARPKNWRRVWARRKSCSRYIVVVSSVLRDDFVEIQQHAGDHRPGGQLAWVEVRIDRRFTLLAPRPGRPPEIAIGSELYTK